MGDATTRDMSDPSPHWYRMVVALDLSEYAEIVLEHALDQAARHGSPDLHFIAVQESKHVELGDVKAQLAALVYPGLELFKGTATNWRAHLHVRTGRPDEEIVELAGEVQADLVIVGRFGVHGDRRTLGSIAERVVASVSCPVLVIGLTERAVPALDACADCAQAREESAGERWFCAAHSAPDRMGMTTRVSSTGFTGSGPMW
jgi:nucleotide-binding universal stress UspA family protein